MVFSNLRKHTKTIMWVIAIFIVPAFVIWNIGSSVKERRSGFAGTIFGRKVSWKEFVLEKRATRNDAWMRYGDELDPSFNLDEQTWTRLIVLQEAKKEKIKVSDKELLGYIKSLPTFQYAKLDPENYSMIIARLFQQPPAEFEEGIRHSIMINKLMDKLVSHITASNEEVKQAYRNDHESASASYIIIEPKNFTELVSFEDKKAIENYYENNKEQFKKQEQVNVEYIEVPLEKFKDNIQISDERIKKYYENNKNEFVQEPSVEGEDEEIKYKDLSEVTDSIKEKLIEKEMTSQASDVSRQVMNRLYSDANFSDVAKEYGLTAEKTGPFSMFEEIPKVGLSFPFLKAAFSLKIGEISEIIKTPTAFYILKPLKKISPYVPEFNDAEDLVKERYKIAEAEKLAQAEGEAVRLKLLDLLADKKTGFEQAVKELNYELKHVDNIARSGYVQDLGYAQDFANAVFGLEKNEVSPLLKTPRGFCLVQLNEITPVDEEQFEKDRENYRTRVLVEKKSKFLNEWFEEIKVKANPQSFIEENQLQ